MRKQIVKLDKKQIIVTELRVVELKGLIEKVGADFLKFEFGSGQAENLQAGIAFLQAHISEIFPDVTAEDMENAYPSEIEAMVEAFLDVNFFGVRRIAGGIMDFLERLARLNMAPVPGSKK